jgi:hypothetical protein
MMIMVIALLILHISIGLALLATFVVRYIGLLTRRIEPQQGRSLILGLGSALVASGLVLVVVTQSTLSSACLSSLGIIAVIGVLEAGLYSLGRRVPVRTR